MKKIFLYLKSNGYELLSFSSDNFSVTGKYIIQVRKTTTGFSLVKKEVGTLKACSPVITRRTADEIISFLAFCRNL